MINRLALIGVGLIGGSLTRGLKYGGKVRTVVGYGRNAANLQRAIELDVIDEAASSIAAAVKDADVIVIATPLGAMAKVIAEVCAAAPKTAIITDVGSAKQCVVDDFIAAGGHLPNLVPGHPIAGREHSGVEATDPALFVEKRVILTPIAETDAEALKTVRLMWQQVGADVADMDITAHDQILAATSHLPHILAFNLVDSLAKLKEHDDIFAYAAGGFRDFTRIASSDPTMWRDICLANRQQILTVLDYYAADLLELRTAIDESDGDTLAKVFSDSKTCRDEAVQRHRALSHPEADISAAATQLSRAVRDTVSGRAASIKDRFGRLVRRRKDT